MLIAAAALFDHSRRNRGSVQPPVVGADSTAGGKTRRIQETKCTCTGCGNVWFFGKQDENERLVDTMSNCSKTLFTCYCLPLLFLPDKKVTDLGKCPKCGSRAVKREIVVHEV